MPKPVHSAKAPAVVGPYSHAAVVGDLIFCSGQIGIDPKSGELAEGVEAQMRLVLENLAHVLEAAGSDRNQVAKTTIFLVRMEDYALVNELYADFFGEHKPARSTVAVTALPKGAQVEIECVARLA